MRGGRNVVASIRKRDGKTVVAVQRRSVVRVAEVPARQSFGQLAGLHSTEDALDLKSSVALVIDQDTREVLFSKNDHAVLPIASLTKLMTGLLISEAQSAFRRTDHHHPGRRRHREGQPLAPDASAPRCRAANCCTWR